MNLIPLLFQEMTLNPFKSLTMAGTSKPMQTGSIKLNPITKSQSILSPAENRQANQVYRNLTDAIKRREDSLPEGHVTLSETADGTLVGSGSFGEDSIDELAVTGRYNASQIDFYKLVSRERVKKVTAY